VGAENQLGRVLARTAIKIINVFMVTHSMPCGFLVPEIKKYVNLVALYYVLPMLAMLFFLSGVFVSFRCFADWNISGTYQNRYTAGNTHRPCTPVH